MKNRLLTLAGTLALLAIFGRFYAVPVLAQVRAALVKNVDEKGRIPYAQNANLECTTATGFCNVAFPSPIPAGKRLVVENVNATIESASGVANTHIEGHGSLNYGLPSHTNNQFLFTVNETVLAFYEAGDTPIFGVALGPGGTSAGFNVTITGYLVDLTI